MPKSTQISSVIPEYRYVMSPEVNDKLIDNVKHLITTANGVLNILEGKKNGLMKCDWTVIAESKYRMSLCNSSAKKALALIRNENFNGELNLTQSFDCDLNDIDKKELRNLVLSMSPHELLEKLRQ